MAALADLTRAAGGTAYRVIGGNMVTFHSARRETRFLARIDGADSGAPVSVDGVHQDSVLHRDVERPMGSADHPVEGRHRRFGSSVDTPSRYA